MINKAKEKSCFNEWFNDQTIINTSNEQYDPFYYLDVMLSNLRILYNHKTIEYKDYRTIETILDVYYDILIAKENGE